MHDVSTKSIPETVVDRSPSPATQQAEVESQGFDVSSNKSQGEPADSGATESPVGYPHIQFRRVECVDFSKPPEPLSDNSELDKSSE